MIKFEIGKRYSMKSVCDSDCVWKYNVTSRTAKTITLDHQNTFRVKEYDGSELITPLGSYSMAPILRADRMAV